MFINYSETLSYISNAVILFHFIFFRENAISLYKLLPTLKNNSIRMSGVFKRDLCHIIPHWYNRVPQHRWGYRPELVMIL